MRTGQARLSSEVFLASMQSKRIEDIENYNAKSICFFRAMFDLARQNGIGAKLKKIKRSETLFW